MYFIYIYIYIYIVYARRTSAPFVHVSTCVFSSCARIHNIHEQAYIGVCTAASCVQYDSQLYVCYDHACVAMYEGGICHIVCM